MARTIRSIFSTLPLFYIAGFLLIALIFITKNPYLYVYPPLLIDDSFLLQHHFNNPGNLFYFYHGYFSLVPNVTAKVIVACFPIEWIPRIFAMVSLIVCTSTIWLFCLDWYAPLISNRNARLTIAALIAIQPIGNWPLHGTLMFQIWNFVIMIFLLLIAEPFIDNLQWLFMTAVLLIFICSNPVSVCFVPVFVWYGIRSLQQKNLVCFCSHLMLCCGVFIYLSIGVIHRATLLDNIVNHFYYIARYSLVSGLERILLDSFFPATLRIIVRETFPLLTAAISLVVIVFLCFFVLNAMRRNRNIARLSVLALYTCVTFTIFCIASRMGPGKNYYLAEKAFRYFYVQQYCLLLLFLISAYYFLKHMKLRAKYFSVIAAFVLVVAVSVIENYRYHYSEYPRNLLNSFHMPFERGSLYDAGIKVAQCLDRAQNSAAAAEALFCEETVPPIKLHFRQGKEELNLY